MEQYGNMGMLGPKVVVFSIVAFRLKFVVSDGVEICTMTDVLRCVFQVSTFFRVIKVVWTVQTIKDGLTLFSDFTSTYRERERDPSKVAYTVTFWALFKKQRLLKNLPVPFLSQLCSSPMIQSWFQVSCQKDLCIRHGWLFVACRAVRHSFVFCRGHQKWDPHFLGE